MNINDFLVWYKFFGQKLHEFRITLSEGVQAFFVLNATNVSEENEKLASMTYATLTYVAMKDTFENVISGLVSVSLFNGISTFVGYLMLKLS